MSEGYRELYGSGQEVEVKRATHDGWVWHPGRVRYDHGDYVMVIPGGSEVAFQFAPDSVRKPGEDKA